VLRTLRGAMAALQPWVDELVGAAQAQLGAVAQMRKATAQAQPVGERRLTQALDDGALAAGAVEARWREALVLDPVLARPVSARARWSGRRGTARRAGALGPLVDDARTALGEQLEIAARVAWQEAMGALVDDDVPGGAALAARLGDDGPGRRRAAQEAAAGRVQDARAELVEWAEGQETGAALTAAARALGPTGLLAVALSAACGVPAALRTLDGVLPAGGGDGLVTRLRDIAAGRGRALVEAALEPLTAVLDAVEEQEGAAVGLAVRSAELKGALRRARGGER
ncbi:MAG: hypothetical protein ACTMIR_15320, partial [Cellulomonadaceae bacterium]